MRAQPEAKGLAVQGIMLTIISFSYAFPYGLSGTPPPLYSGSAAVSAVPELLYLFQRTKC